jgi:DNA-binding transcriptional LysR family regulator
MIDLALDLRYLRCAIIAAELGSFRRTADHLDLPQSAVSRRIALLERRLGFALFDRSRSGVRVTAAGKRFLEHALPGANQLSVAAREAISILKGASGEVRIGVVAYLTGGEFWRILQAFRAMFPGVHVTLKECSVAQAARLVASRDVDIAFVTGSDVSVGCASQVLWSDNLLAALPADHHLARQLGISWEDLRHEIFVVAGSGVGPDVQRCIIGRLVRSGYKPQISVQDVSQASVLEMVALGYGITLVCSSWIRADSDDIAFRPVTLGSETVVTSAIWLEENSNPNVRKLVEVAKKVGSAQMDCGRSKPQI